MQLKGTHMIKRMSALLAIVALMLGIAACGDDEEESGGGGGSASEEPVAEIAELTGDNTQVTFDEGFVTALGDLGLTPGGVGDAKLVQGGAAAQFPITGGEVTYYDPDSDVRPYVQGIIEHEGSGLSLTAGKTTVELTDFVIDPATSELTGTVTANGEVAAEDALLFKLDGSTLEPLAMEGDAAVLEGTQVLLSADAAALLNDTFKVDALQEDLLIGVSKISVTG
jgi:hypothetical protein